MEKGSNVDGRCMVPLAVAVYCKSGVYRRR